MTITESIKDINESGESSYRKHKIYLYKEEFNNFKEAFNQVSEFIISEKERKLYPIRNQKTLLKKKILKKKNKVILILPKLT